MKLSFLFIFLNLSNFVFSQKVDTIISTKWYKSYYSYNLKTPVYVSYDIYKGGGSCDRGSTSFKTGGLKKIAKAKDYNKSGFDQGHLVPFEDFAFDCKAAESTFFYYNAIPQYPNLNRGEWKKWEFIIREISKNDSLRVITGGAKWKTHIGDSVMVPQLCWKLVWSKSKKVVIYALLFENKVDNGKVTTETITTLERKIGFKIRQHLK
jgi:DNA/RNA endonuclease G (NUC1)